MVESWIAASTWGDSNNIKQFDLQKLWVVQGLGDRPKNCETRLGLMIWDKVWQSGDPGLPLCACAGVCTCV